MPSHTSVPTAMKHEERLLINGKLIRAASNQTFENINPATEEILGLVANAGTADMNVAIGASRRAFDVTDWSTNHAFRKRCLEQLHNALLEEKELLRAELIEEVGAPVLTTYSAQLDWPLSEALLGPAGLIDDFTWERRLADSPYTAQPTFRWVWKEAIGVVAAVIPWNFPFEIAITKIGQILATGNTMVIKPAAETPWNTTRIGRIIAEKTDIPPGVVNIITTSDLDVAQMLFTDSRVDMVSFTGSTATGELLLKLAAPTFKRTLLELGGKSASIILDDADFDTVLPGASFACWHSGQGCSLPTRLLLPRSRYAEGVEILTETYSNIPYGDPNDERNIAGPLISKKQQERVLGFIRKGVDEGARLAVGGGIPKHLAKGYYVEPTLFVDVDNRSSIARQEIFGPVLSVIPYDDDEDAIRLANDNPYGLSGNIATASPERAAKIARALRIGSLTINGGNFYGSDAPYGGYKASGLGRQNGIEGFEQHLQTKSVGSGTPLN